MKWWPRVLLLALILIVALVVALMLPKIRMDSAREEEGERVYLIGMSQANLVEPWRVTMNLEFAEAAAEHDNLRVIYTDAAQDTRRQIADVDMLMG